MKKIINKLILVLAVGTFFTACEENAIPELTVPLNTDQVAQAKFFFHADDAPSVNVFMNGDKVSSVASSTAGAEQGSAYGSVFPSNAYAVVPTGTVEISVRDLEGNDLASSQATISSGNSYSVYLVGNEGSYEVFAMEDNLPAANNDKIFWRFVNTMAEIPFEVNAYAVRAAVPETDNSPAEPARVISLGSNIGFKEGGEYVQLDPGSYAFKIFDATSDYDPLTSTPFIQHSLALATLGRVYTTQIRGTYSEPIGTGKIDYWRDR